MCGDPARPNPTGRDDIVTDDIVTDDIVTDDMVTEAKGSNGDAQERA